MNYSHTTKYPPEYWNLKTPNPIQFNNALPQTASSVSSKFNQFISQQSRLTPVTPTTENTSTPTITDTKQVASTNSNKIKRLGMSAALMGVGLLLHKLPAHKSSFNLVSSDWKDWARMALSVGAVDQINKALQWKPEPWQLGLQTVTAITAISNGFTKKGWKQFPLLAIFIPLLVQGTHYLNEFTDQKLKETNSDIPGWIPKVLISGASTVLGIVALRNIIKTDWYNKLTGQSSSGQSSQVIGAEAVVCTRCGAQHLICMSELGDMLGSFSLWIKQGLKGHGKGSS